MLVPADDGGLMEITFIGTEGGFVGPVRPPVTVVSVMVTVSGVVGLVAYI